MGSTNLNSNMTNKEWLWFKQNDIYRLSNKIPIVVYV